jgi:hypothetical protein
MSIGALIMGWGIAELAIMINTVAVYAYLNDCFPKHQASSFCAHLDLKLTVYHH